MQYAVNAVSQSSPHSILLNSSPSKSIPSQGNFLIEKIDALPSLPDDDYNTGARADLTFTSSIKTWPS